MFIDEAQKMQERKEPLKILTKASGSEVDAEYDDLKQQLALLDDKCPRYDVFNVYTALFPKIIESESPVVVKRNTEVIEKRDALVKIAGCAPLGPPWFTFCLEHRYNEHQRSAYLVRWDKENRKYVCTSMFDSVRVPGMVEFLPNAFEVLLGDDDVFGGCVFGKDLMGANLDSVKRGAQVVRTCIELLNWDREDVPTQTLVNPKEHKDRDKKEGGSKKSDPTIIKFEPFLKVIRSGAHRGSGGGHASPGQHLVKGHYANFRYEAPMFGHKPVLGRTYGRVWMKPCMRGNPTHGVASAPKHVIEIGSLTNIHRSQTTF
jgi:hypothetical protein